jgi:hypothetical protein
MSAALSSKPMKVRAAPAVAAPAPARRLSWGESLIQTLTRQWVAAPVFIVSLALLAWSGVTCLTAKNSVVHARQQSPTVESNAVVTAESVAELESNVQTAARRLIRERQTVARMLSRLEQQAHGLGFRFEVSTKPAVTNAAGFKELTIQSAVISLENSSDREGVAFVRLLKWLHQVSQLEGKVEVATLSLRSKGDGLAQAQVELNFWRIDEEPAPK